MPKSKIASSKLTSKKNLRLRGVNGRFLKMVAEAPVAAVVEAPVAEAPVAAVVEAPVAEALKAPAPVAIPVVGPEELIVTREGYNNLPHKAYKQVMKIGYEKAEIRQAIDVMVALKSNLQSALAVVTLKGYKSWHLPLLVAIKEASDFAGHVRVLTWMWEHQGWSFHELYEAFPNGGKQGVLTTSETRWKARNLIQLLDGVRKASLAARKDGKQVNSKTPQKVIDSLCEEAFYLGWFE